MPQVQTWVERKDPEWGKVERVELSEPNRAALEKLTQADECIDSEGEVHRFNLFAEDHKMGKRVSTISEMRHLLGGVALILCRQARNSCHTNESRLAGAPKWERVSHRADSGARQECVL